MVVVVSLLLSTLLFIFPVRLQRAIETMYVEYDEDGNGVLSFPEFKNLMHAMMPMVEISDRQLTKMFQRVIEYDGAGREFMDSVSPQAFAKLCDRYGIVPYRRMVAASGGTLASDGSAHRDVDISAEAAAIAGIKSIATALRPTVDDEGGGGGGGGDATPGFGSDESGDGGDGAPGRSAAAGGGGDSGRGALGTGSSGGLDATRPGSRRGSVSRGGARGETAGSARPASRSPVRRGSSSRRGRRSVAAASGASGGGDAGEDGGAGRGRQGRRGSTYGGMEVGGLGMSTRLTARQAAVLSGNGDGDGAGDGAGDGDDADGGEIDAGEDDGGR